MLFPKKVKFRKNHTNRENPAKAKNKVATRGVNVSFGSHALKSQDSGRITSNQIEASRRVISRTVGKTGKVWVRIFPDIPFTKKPAEVKMGKGKGDPQGFYVQVRPGRVLFEVDGVNDKTAMESLRKAGMKMPVRTKIVARL